MYTFSIVGFSRSPKEKISKIRFSYVIVLCQQDNINCKVISYRRNYNPGLMKNKGFNSVDSGCTILNILNPFSDPEEVPTNRLLLVKGGTDGTERTDIG